MNKKRVFILSLIVVVLTGVFFWLEFEKTEPVGFSMVKVEKNVLSEKPQTVDNAIATTTELATTTKTATTTSSTLANPASGNCEKKGGTLRIQTKEDGSQYGLCYFDDARACEEWAMFRGECPVGGVKTTGYDTLAEKYCAWLGGRTLAVTDPVCTFNDGSTCLDADLYLDACKKGDWPKK